MGTPINSLVTWQESRSLSFKEEKAFSEGGAVVVGSRGERGEEETEEKEGSHGNGIRHFGEGEKCNVGKLGLFVRELEE